MKYPAYFVMNINGFDWNITFTYDTNKLRRNNGTITLGVCDRNEMTIYIYAGLSYNIQKKVLIHEIVHAYMFSYGYMLTEDEEELVCEIISEYGEDIVRNSKLVLDKNFSKII